MNLTSGTDAAGRAARAARIVETWLLTLVLGAMVLLGALQIVLRNVWGLGLDWADEALRLMVLWVTMIGAVAASGEQRHVSIDALSRYLPRRAGRAIGRAVSGIAAGVCTLLAWYSWEFVAQTWAAGDRVLGGRVPAWIAESILPAGFALIAIRYAVAVFLVPEPRAGGAGEH